MRAVHSCKSWFWDSIRDAKVLVVNLRRTFPQKRQKRRQKSLCKKVYKSDGSNTVLSYEFSSTLISQHCFLRIWGVAKYIPMDRKIAISWEKDRILSFTL